VRFQYLQDKTLACYPAIVLLTAAGVTMVVYSLMRRKTAA